MAGVDFSYFLAGRGPDNTTGREWLMKIYTVKRELILEGLKKPFAIQQSRSNKRKAISLIDIVSPFPNALDDLVIRFMVWQSTGQDMNIMPSPL